MVLANHFAERRAHSGARRLLPWAGVVLSVLINVGGWLLAYGRLEERVDELQYQVRELRTIMLEHNAR